MDEYISRGAMMDMLSNQQRKANRMEDIVLIADIRRAARVIPAADVVEVCHGEWLTDTEKGDKYCSECGTGARWDSIGREFLLTTYCHHCGARMGW